MFTHTCYGCDSDKNRETLIFDIGRKSMAGFSPFRFHIPDLIISPVFGQLAAANLAKARGKMMVINKAQGGAAGTHQIG